MYISETLAYVHKSELQSDCFEHLWVDIKLKSKTFSINSLLDHQSLKIMISFFVNLKAF